MAELYALKVMGQVISNDKENLPSLLQKPVGIHSLKSYQDVLCIRCNAPIATAMSGFVGKDLHYMLQCPECDLKFKYKIDTNVDFNDPITMNGLHARFQGFALNKYYGLLGYVRKLQITD